MVTATGCPDIKHRSDRICPLRSAAVVQLPRRLARNAPGERASVCFADITAFLALIQLAALSRFSQIPELWRIESRPVAHPGRLSLSPCLPVFLFPGWQTGRPPPLQLPGRPSIPWQHLALLPAEFVRLGGRGLGAVRLPLPISFGG